MKKYIIFLLIVVLALSFMMCAYFIKTNADLQKRLREAKGSRDKEFKENIAQTKEEIKKNLDEKYRADIVSYQAMRKRLERLKSDSNHN